MNLLPIAAVIFFAVFTQTVAGFGLALVSMPFLVGLLGIQMAAPLVAIVGLISESFILVRNLESLDFPAIKQLGIGSVVGIPLGVLALEGMNETVVSFILGIVIILYSLFAFFVPKLPEIKGAGWGYGFGIIGGLLAGAYNTGGPVLVIYGSSRRWSPSKFKGNLQGLFLIHGFAVIVSHSLSGNLTPVVMGTSLMAIPAILLALLIGFTLDRRIDSVVFRKIVLVLLLVLGLRLIIP